MVCLDCKKKGTGRPGKLKKKTTVGFGVVVDELRVLLLLSWWVQAEDFGLFCL
jgi:hypothetical protein